MYISPPEANCKKLIQFLSVFRTSSDRKSINFLKILYIGNISFLIFVLTGDQCMIADLRIKQEPVALTDRERADKLAERLSNEAYSRGFEAGNYGNTTDHLQHGVQMSAGMTSLQPAHPPTPDLSPALPTPAMWNSKINKAGTVTTPDGEYALTFPYFCLSLTFYICRKAICN